MQFDGGASRRGFGTLFRDLVEESVSLVRDEVHLAKLEVVKALHGIGLGTMLTATGAVFIVLGALALAIGIVLLIGDQWLPADRYWLAALIIMLVTGALAALLAKHGADLVSPESLAPRQTLSTLKEDKEWMKQRLTSDATLS
ncbi:MAG TPA: phage holin family protein [Gemmatimonadaceae bacterium]